MPRLCEIPECERKHKVRGLCAGHAWRLKKGLPLVPLRETESRDTPVSERIEKNSVLNSETGCRDWIGTPSGEGYGLVNHSGGSELAHRAAWRISFGDIPEGKVIDHGCGNRSCVNIRHLFLVGYRENGEHRTKWNSRTGIRNVYPYNKSGKYEVRVASGGVRFTASPIETLDEAADIAERMRRMLGFHEPSISESEERFA